MAKKMPLVGPLAVMQMVQEGMGSLGSQVPGVTEEEQEQMQRYQEGVERARQVQGLYRRLGALGLQERAEAGMQSFDPRMAAIMGPAGLAGTRRLGQLGGIAGVRGEIEGRMRAEAIDPERKRETLRQRMQVVAAASAGKTREALFTDLAAIAGGDPVLLKEARSMAQSGRSQEAGTVGGYVEDVFNLIGLGGKRS